VTDRQTIRSPQVRGPLQGPADGTDSTVGKGWRERGETRRGPNITPPAAARQDAIHRFPNACASLSRGLGWRVDIHTRGASPSLATAEFDLPSRPRVPFLGHPVSTGAARPCRDPSERTREQAYVPAEQPSAPQGARLPAAHAHPCGALHPVRASPQGPQESRGLSLPARPSSCLHVRAPGVASPHPRRRPAPRLAAWTPQRRRHRRGAPPARRPSRRPSPAGRIRRRPARRLRGRPGRGERRAPPSGPAPAPAPVPRAPRGSPGRVRAGRAGARAGRPRVVPGTRRRPRPLSATGPRCRFRDGELTRCATC
jgi:hypothetical protein